MRTSGPPRAKRSGSWSWRWLMSEVSSTVLPALYSPTTPTRHSVVLTRKMLIQLTHTGSSRKPTHSYAWACKPPPTLYENPTMSGIRFTHIDHCSVIVTDVARSRAFYGGVLGLKEIP